MMSKGGIVSNPKVRTNSSNHSCEVKSELRRGPWTIEEDNLLLQCVSSNGEGRWNSLAKFSGLKRTGKSCRLRWLNYLKPDIKRGNLSPHEQLLILELHSKWGNRWSRIAQHLPGRTDNEIKNYWRTRVQRQARQLHLDSNSNKFLEAVRTFWQPAASTMEHCPSPVSSSSLSAAAQKFEFPPDQARSSLVTDPGGKTIRQQQPDGVLIPEEVQFGGFIQDDYYQLVSEPQNGLMSEFHVEGSDWVGEGHPGSCTFWETDELYW